LLLLAMSGWVCAQEATRPDSRPQATRSSKRNEDDPQLKVLSADEWRRLDTSIDRALAWLASQQKADGSFPTLDRGQPGVTSFCVLAFMAHGHSPGQGEYGERLDLATNYILACQRESGLINLLGPEGPRIQTAIDPQIGEPAAYSHAISSLALSEMYGMGQPKRAQQLERSINKSLTVTYEMQHWPKDLDVDKGGWRYVTDDGPRDSDLSITGWQLMFLRSARNAGFDVPQKRIDEAIEYIRRTFNNDTGTFGYTTGRGDGSTRAMAGAGILALAHAGLHNSPEAQRAGKWLLAHDFDDYNSSIGNPVERYHYSLFNSCQAMYQLGGTYWEKFFPRTVAALLSHQQPDGSWDAEGLQRDRQFGNAYTTALVVLALGSPNQFLPVFQR
jgi:hypothetical protein